LRRNNLGDRGQVRTRVEAILRDRGVWNAPSKVLGAILIVIGAIFNPELVPTHHHMIIYYRKYLRKLKKDSIIN